MRSEGLRSGHLVGKKGLEFNFDDQLRGSDGERVLVVDSRGRRIDEFVEAPATAGQNLELTLDLELQQEAEEALGRPRRCGRGTRPTGRRRAGPALLARPTIPNKFARRLQKEEWDALVSSPFHPLQNRAIQNSYPPGSVFKIVLGHRPALRGTRRLRQGLVRRLGAPARSAAALPSVAAVTAGSICTTRSSTAATSTSTRRVRSSASTRSPSTRASSVSASEPGIDLDGERAGLVPDAAWSQRVRNTRWYPGETVSVAIGQGPLLVTPLQAAVMFAAVVNGGRLVTPYLVDEHAQVGEGSAAR